MNRKLKFSWGHIVAFLALIFIAYVVFMGISYYTLGNYIVAGIGAAVCVLILAATILGAQMAKGSATKYEKAIRWERLLLFLSLPMLIIVYIPYNHFWHIQSQEDVIVNTFRSSMSQAKDMFDDYEEYVEDRYVSNQNYLNRSYYNSGEKQNRLDELRLILASSDYETMRNEATKWIDNSSEDPSVWNIFLFGNVDKLIDAINGWSASLTERSSTLTDYEKSIIEASRSTRPNLRNEGFAPFDATEVDYGGNGSVPGGVLELQKLKNIYSDYSFAPSLIGLLVLVLCYAMVLLPYFIQERHARNCEQFWDFWVFSRDAAPVTRGPIDMPGRSNMPGVPTPPQPGVPMPPRPGAPMPPFSSSHSQQPGFTPQQGNYNPQQANNNQSNKQKGAPV